jgi:acetyl-CoA acetyltransferase family protein
MGTQGQSRDVVFLAARRTGFGAFGGSLKELSATQLGVVSARAALASAGLEPADVGHVVFGNALQTSADAIYLARHIGLLAGLPREVPAVTMNRLCGSGFQAVASGAAEILLGDAQVVLAGGTESMSQAPHVVRGARWGQLRLGKAAGAFEDLLWKALEDSQCGLTMAETAEELGDRYGVTREASDQVALRSQLRAAAAWADGRFDAEIAPVTLQTRKGEVEYAADEHIRPDPDLEALARLRPYFRENGLVTAGNASGIGDGSASLIMADAAWAAERELEPLGRLVSWCFVGVHPEIMGIGPAPAIRGALTKAGLSLQEMDLVEVNEAFAPQYLAVEKELELDPDRTNVNGGAIALTHPLAASGARITVHLLHELRRRGGRFAVGAACIGGGQGGAVVVEAL